MPKGIKKPTAESLRAAIDKQNASIHDKELAIKQAKADYDAKVKRLKHEISEGNANLHKLRKEYDAFIRNEQQEILSTMLFNSELSSSEVTKAINAMKALLEKNADHEKALRWLQEVSEAHQNSTITNLVSEIKQETQEKQENAVRGPGVSSPDAEQES